MDISILLKGTPELYRDKGVPKQRSVFFRVARIYSELQRTMMRAQRKTPLSSKTRIAVAHGWGHYKDTPNAEEGRGRGTRMMKSILQSEPRPSGSGHSEHAHPRRLGLGVTPGQDTAVLEDEYSGGTLKEQR